MSPKSHRLFVSRPNGPRVIHTYIGPGNTFSKYDSKYFRFVCISKCFKILYGSDQKTLKIHLKRLRSEGRMPVVRSGTHIGRSHYVGDTVARARGGVRNTSGFTVMSPPGAPGGCGEARGVPHLNKRNVGHAEVNFAFRYTSAVLVCQVVRMVGQKVKICSK